MVVPRNLNDSTAASVLSMMKSGNNAGVFLHDHFHCFECVQLQVVITAPDGQLFNLLSDPSISRSQEWHMRNKLI